MRFFEKISPRTLELELSRSLKLERWVIPALRRFLFLGKISSRSLELELSFLLERELNPWVFLTFLRSFSFLQELCSRSLELQLSLLIAFYLNRLALVADLRFRFPREVSFLY